ncbi:lasso peptide biosynthesis PqqD family chaperone [Actinosynnema sp. NPDC023794]|jgi:citrate synthase
MPLRIRDGVSTADTEYGTVLLDERTGEYWQLNPTGAEVVRLLMAGRTPAEAVQALTEQFEVDEPQARNDVETLLDSLRSADLVTS